MKYIFQDLKLLFKWVIPNDIAITCLENKECIILRRRIGGLWKVENCIPCDEGSIILGVKATPSKYVFTFKIF